MSGTLKILIAFFIFFSFFSISSSVYAWGASVSGPTIDMYRTQIIEKIGIEKVVIARLEAATKRMSIFDQRITSRLNKTPDSCKFKSEAQKALLLAKSKIPSNIINMLYFSNDKKTEVSNSLDISIVRKIKTDLEQSLSSMKVAVEELSKCSL